jgi:CheY-like chemotaxis protein
LAIDDSPDSLQVLHLLLKRNGASVITADSAVEALKILDQKTPNIIICDIGMPGEDGYSFLQKLRSGETLAGKSHIPAAALTAYTREEEKKEALKSGFQVHLSKPIQESVLVDAVARLAGI